MLLGSNPSPFGLRVINVFPFVDLISPVQAYIKAFYVAGGIHAYTVNVNPAAQLIRKLSSTQWRAGKYVLAFL